MTTDHSPEPWKHDGLESIVDANGEFILGGGGWMEGAILDDNPNCRRILACVNACRGIPTEELEAAIHDTGLKRYFHTPGPLSTCKTHNFAWFGQGTCPACHNTQTP